MTNFTILYCPHYAREIAFTHTKEQLEKMLKERQTRMKSIKPSADWFEMWDKGWLPQECWDIWANEYDRLYEEVEIIKVAIDWHKRVEEFKKTQLQRPFYIMESEK